MSVELIKAVKGSDLHKVKKLLEHGRGVNGVDSYGNTALSWAARFGYVDIVTVLLNEKNIDINKANNDGDTPLHEAARKDHAFVVEMLLHQESIQVNKTNRVSNIPLHEGAWCGNASIVDMLLKSGESDDIHKTEWYGDTALHVAAGMGNTPVVKVLLHRGSIADISKANKQGNTPLHLAAERGIADTIEVLASHGADINAKNEWLMTPLNILEKKLMQTPQAIAKNQEAKDAMLRGHARYTGLTDLNTALAFKEVMVTDSGLDILPPEMVFHIINFTLGMPVKTFLNKVYDYYDKSGFPSFFKPVVPIKSIPQELLFINEEESEQSESHKRKREEDNSQISSKKFHL